MARLSKGATRSAREERAELPDGFAVGKRIVVHVQGTLVRFDSQWISVQDGPCKSRVSRRATFNEPGALQSKTGQEVRFLVAGELKTYGKKGGLLLLHPNGRSSSISSAHAKTILMAPPEDAVEDAVESDDE